MVIVCPRCKRVFRSWRSFVVHIIMGRHGGGIKSSRSIRYGYIRRGKALRRRQH